MRAGLVGAGYWGSNLAREINSNPNLYLSFIVEPNEVSMDKLGKQYPNSLKYFGAEQLTPNLADIVFVATPPQNHEPVLDTLRARGYKNICITKPYCLSSLDAEKYTDIVKIVDYTFLFSNAVKNIKKYLEPLGKVLSIYCRRGNLGKIQQCGVQYDLCAHDLSILCYLGFVPNTETIQGQFSSLSMTAIMTSNNGVNISIQNSWLSHVKTKEMIFVCENGTLVYDDNENDKIRIYHSHVELPNDSFKMQYKYGDINIPYISANNPLGEMINEACKSVINKEQHKTVPISLYIHRIMEKMNACRKQQNR